MVGRLGRSSLSGDSSLRHDIETGCAVQCVRPLFQPGAEIHSLTDAFEPILRMGFEINGHKMNLDFRNSVLDFRNSSGFVRRSQNRFFAINCF
jgi:hypothetical protein